MSDLISRRAAIKAIDDLPNCYNGYSDAYDKAYIIGVLEEVPTIEPKRGKWLLHEYPDGYYHTECSECGKVYSENVYFLRKPNYCPNCGAKMERSEE